MTNSATEVLEKCETFYKKLFKLMNEKWACTIELMRESNIVDFCWEKRRDSNLEHFRSHVQVAVAVAKDQEFG